MFNTDVMSEFCHMYYGTDFAISAEEGSQSLICLVGLPRLRMPPRIVCACQLIPSPTLSCPTFDRQRLVAYYYSVAEPLHIRRWSRRCPRQQWALQLDMSVSSEASCVKRGTLAYHTCPLRTVSPELMEHEDLINVCARDLCR